MKITATLTSDQLQEIKKITEQWIRVKKLKGLKGQKIQIIGNILIYAGSKSGFYKITPELFAFEGMHHDAWSEGGLVLGHVFVPDKKDNRVYLSVFCPATKEGSLAARMELHNAVLCED
jgi:hypothetical protein